jgi:hypothetical protein
MNWPSTERSGFLELLREKRVPVKRTIIHLDPNYPLRPGEAENLESDRTEIRKLHRAGVSKAEMARRLIGARTSVHRILKARKSSA